MTIRLTIILLVCVAGCILAQFQDGDSPHKGTNTPRRFKPHTPRVTPTAQSVFANQKFRRPIPLKARPAQTSDIPHEVSVFTHGGGSRNLRPQAPPASKQTLNTDSEEDSSSLHSNSEIKPVNEENEKDEDVVQLLSNSGSISSFHSTSNNLVTPAPQPIPVQYRPLPTISVTKPTLLPDQNIPPVQYRPHKAKSHKPIEDISEVRSDQTTVHFRSKPTKQQRLVESTPENRSLYDQGSIQYKSKSAKAHKQNEEIPESRSDIDQISLQYRLKSSKQQKYIEDIGEARSYNKPRQPPKKLTAETDYYTSRPKKPVAQVIRRYREETDDGSIVWGFENDDGSYKEEVIGIDCITRGKYGYVDPDGIRREYTYETGIKCDEEEQQEDILNTFVDYQENKLVLPSGKTIDLSSMGKKQARRPQFAYRN
ncbi:uncharacterized protein LOC122505990 isoform X2 [Leptopilina heterotoma]|uniref:uncharacterized protein LOC122505990 isoform X2 n=1 Tax=Leptopilina heterotoma TaxID=63436 RepID=UPI001CA91533|nr:uncharacterized protein LOC122505990 isoform X2 [Leptopilina heterotoma]